MRHAVVLYCVVLCHIAVWCAVSSWDVFDNGVRTESKIEVTFIQVNTVVRGVMLSCAAGCAARPC